MKTTDMRKSEIYVSPEIEIIDFTVQSGILEGSQSGETIDTCETFTGCWSD